MNKDSQLPEKLKGISLVDLDDIQIFNFFLKEYAVEGVFGRAGLVHETRDAEGEEDTRKGFLKLDGDLKGEFEGWVGRGGRLGWGRVR